MRSQHSHRHGWMSVRRRIPAKSLARIRELMREAAPAQATVKGVELDNLEALKQENTILREWIALHLKPGKVVDMEERVRKRME